MLKNLLPWSLVALIVGVFGVIVYRHVLPTFDQPIYLDEIRDSLPPPSGGTYLEEIQSGLTRQEAGEPATPATSPTLQPDDPADSGEPDADAMPDSTEQPQQFRVDQGAGLPGR